MIFTSTNPSLLNSSALINPSLFTSSPIITVGAFVAVVSIIYVSTPYAVVFLAISLFTADIAIIVFSACAENSETNTLYKIYIFNG